MCYSICYSIWGIQNWRHDEFYRSANHSSARTAGRAPSIAPVWKQFWSLTIIIWKSGGYQTENLIRKPGDGNTLQDPASVHFRLNVSLCLDIPVFSAWLSLIPPSLCPTQSAIIASNVISHRHVIWFLYTISWEILQNFYENQLQRAAPISYFGRAFSTRQRYRLVPLRT